MYNSIYVYSWNIHKNQQFVYVFLAAFLIGGFLSGTTVGFFLICQLLNWHFDLGLSLWSRRNFFKIFCAQLCAGVSVGGGSWLMPYLAWHCCPWMCQDKTVGECDLLKSSMNFMQLSDLREKTPDPAYALLSPVVWTDPSSWSDFIYSLICSIKRFWELSDKAP